MAREIDIPYDSEGIRRLQLELHMQEDSDLHENPRFVDPLSPELEELWQEIVDSVRATEEYTNPEMAKIWNDPDIPTALRDRALIVAHGSYMAAKLLGFGSKLANMGGVGDQFTVTEGLESEYRQWHLDAIERQYSTGLEILNPQSYLSWAMAFFRDGNIDQEQFEKYLGSLDIRRAQRQYGNAPLWALESPRFEGDLLDYGRFPLLADVFFGFYNGEKIQAWGMEKLDKWLDHRIDQTAPQSSPEWLDWADDQEAFELCGWLLTAKGFVSDEIRAKMIDYFNWEILRDQRRDEYWTHKLTLEEGLQIWSALDDPDEKLAVLEYALDLNTQRRKFNEERGDEPVYDRRALPEVIEWTVTLEKLREELEQLDPGSKLAEMLTIEISLGEQEIAKRETRED